jgi:hypothetical protein
MSMDVLQQEGVPFGDRLNAAVPISGLIYGPRSLARLDWIGIFAPRRLPDELSQ